MMTNDLIDCVVKLAIYGYKKFFLSNFFLIENIFKKKIFRFLGYISR